MRQSKTGLLTAGLLVAGVAMAQTDELQQSLYQSAPEDWRAEVIPFPLSFAPDIQLSGVEELRFAPGMFDAEADDYFSYTFIWWLDGTPEISIATLERDLAAYFEGLYAAVSKVEEGKQQRIDTFEVTVQQSGEDRFLGTAEWIDPFVTELPLNLRMEISTWACQNHTAVYFSLTPQPDGHPLWSTMTSMKAGTCAFLE